MLTVSGLLSKSHKLVTRSNRLSLHQRFQNDYCSVPRSESPVEESEKGTWQTSRVARRRRSVPVATLTLKGPSTHGVCRSDLYRHYLSRTFRSAVFEKNANYDKETALLKSLPAFELESRGLALLGLRVDSRYWRFRTGGDIELRLLVDEDGLNDPVAAARGFKVGKLVELVRSKGEEVDNDGSAYNPSSLKSMPTWRRVTAIVSSITDKAVYVRLNSLANFLVSALGRGIDPGSRQCRVHLLKKSEENIYRSRLAALEREIKTAKKFDTLGPAAKTFIPMIYDLPHLVPPEAEDCLKIHDSVIYDNKINDSQKKAIEMCAQCKPVTIIHGPPGTGKTTTLASAILSAVVTRGERVFVVAPSHAACDAIMLAIIRHWPVQRLGEPHKGKLIRLGKEVRLTLSELRVFLPQNVYRNKRGDLQKLERDLEAVRTELLDGSIKVSIEEIMRRMTLPDGDLVEGAGEELGGDSDDELRESESNSALLSIISGKRGELLSLEKKLSQRLLAANRCLENEAAAEANIVVCTTTFGNGGALSELVRSGHFGLLCLDEAGFSDDANVLPLLSKANRLILAGDHLQLPPVVLSDSARRLGYDVSVLERLSSVMPDSVHLLSTQYRSNHVISDWSSAYFYGGKITSHESVAKGLLQALPGVQGGILETTRPLIFIDTRGQHYREDSDPYNSVGGMEESIANYDEAFLVEHLVRKYVSLGVDPAVIGVITPYWAQVSILRSLIWSDHHLRRIEVRTVDGYQGREKEFIILSFVRSNEQRDVGFLEETRRINVSVTRAKKCCIIIGDSDTLCRDQGLRSLINYCQENKAMVAVSAVMS